MRPISYKIEDCAEGPRIGGQAPRGLEDQLKDDHSQYFCTFPLPDDPKMEFSVFHRFDIFGDDESRDLIAHNNRVLAPSELIWSVVHRESSRGELSRRPIESRALEMGPDSSDVVTDDQGNETPYAESKLGGKCFLVRYWLQAEVAELETNGYKHLLQIGMHGSDAIDGFPWDPGYLHVWALDPYDPKTYRFLVEQ